MLHSQSSICIHTAWVAAEHAAETVVKLASAAALGTQLSSGSKHFCWYSFATAATI
eukprot:COSAG01_NODE_46442_length_400_cov_0.843854_1_plen_55_part_01